MNALSFPIKISGFFSQSPRLLQEQAANKLTGWELWRAGQRRTLRRLRGHVGVAMSYAVMWKSALRHIEGRGGWMFLTSLPGGMVWGKVA